MVHSLSFSTFSSGCKKALFIVAVYSGTRHGVFPTKVLVIGLPLPSVLVKIRLSSSVNGKVIHSSAFSIVPVTLEKSTARMGHWTWFASTTTSSL